MIDDEFKGRVPVKGHLVVASPVPPTAAPGVVSGRDTHQDRQQAGHGYSSAMTDEDDVETQWTPAAKEAVAARGEELMTALRDHVALTLGRTARQAEHSEYFASAAALRRAAVAFDDAEFDWCGSSPLGLEADDLDDDEGDEDEDAADHGVLSVVGRWDYRVVDEAALLAAGRAAYAKTWPADTEEDASLAVVDLVSAADEIAHAHGWHALAEVDSLEPVASMTNVVLHEDEGDSWLDSDEDPFEIARQD